MATLDEFSVYFVVSKLLILAYFWATNLTYFSLKFFGILKCVKFREFPEFLPREAMQSAVYAVVVCLCVCLSHSGIVSKRLDHTNNAAR